MKTSKKGMFGIANKYPTGFDVSYGVLDF